ncbi:MAG: hypothetical protein RR412_12920 [Burkholderiaceae bacterium]
MVDVYLTVDVEVWCDDWHDLDAQFPAAFERYVYGRTPRGDFGLPYQLRLLDQHGIKACFFVEPLFALRFGESFLREIVAMIQSAGQEVQLHLHPEWVDEITPSPLPARGAKRPLLRQFDREDQQRLIAIGKRLLEEAGVERVEAFRAGSFGFNADTLSALAANGIGIDASYNATMHGPDSGVAVGQTLLSPITVDGVIELPMSIYRDGLGRLRHVQLSATSWPEMESLLWQASDQEWPAFVILSHNFELLNRARSAPDLVVVDRMQRLCGFLDRHRDRFRTPRLGERVAPSTPAPLSPLSASVLDSLGRIAEQVGRRRYG